MTELFGIEPLEPAYGRRYASKDEAQKSFDSDQDFRCAFGSYINRPQLVAMGVKRIRLRYGKNLTMTTILEVK